MPPWIIAPRSVMMSPNMLSVTITSNHSGFFTNHMRGGVHVGVVALDVGVILLADLVEGALPEVEGVGQHVGLAARASASSSLFRLRGVARRRSAGSARRRGGC